MGNNVSLNHYLFLYELRDLHRAEERFPDGLWHALRSVASSECKEVFSKLMDQTLVHAVRLDEVFKCIRMTPVASPCPIMDSLVEKSAKQKVTTSAAGAQPQDQLTVQVVEEMMNYLVGAYVTAHAYSSLLPQTAVERILALSLREKEGAAKELHQLAQKLDTRPPKARSEQPFIVSNSTVRTLGTELRKGFPLSLT